MYSFEGLASLALIETDPLWSATMLGAADGLRARIGSPLPDNLREAQAEELNSLRNALGEEAFAAAWETGRVMTTEQAIGFALAQSSLS